MSTNTQWNSNKSLITFITVGYVRKKENAKNKESQIIKNSSGKVVRVKFLVGGNVRRGKSLSPDKSFVTFPQRSFL